LLKPSEQEELERIRGCLGTFQDGHECRTTTKIAKELLLGGSFFWMGALCMPYAKSLGCGVYAVTVKKNRA